MKITVTVTVTDDQLRQTTISDSLIGSDWRPSEADDAAEQIANIAAGLCHDAMAVQK